MFSCPHCVIDISKIKYRSLSAFLAETVKNHSVWTVVHSSSLHEIGIRKVERKCFMDDDDNYDFVDEARQASYSALEEELEDDE